MNNKKCQRGFSLIEALVILLVTAILMAVAVPWLTVKKQSGGGEKWLYSNNLNVFFGTRSNSSNVGIGTPYPKARLHVVSAKRIIDDCADGDYCTADGQNVQKKGADMILESTTRAPLLRFSINARNVDFYLNSEVNNIGFGEEALNHNITASGAGNASDENSDYLKTQNNIALGFRTLRNLRDGTGNIAIGFEALRNLQTGSNNVAIGSSAMANCNNVENNVTIATYVSQNICGNSNVSIGQIKTTNGKPSINTKYNVFLSTGSNYLQTTGSASGGNVFIGEDIGIPSGVTAPVAGGAYLNIGDKIVGRFSPNNSNFHQEDLHFKTPNFNIRGAGASSGVLYYRINVGTSDVRLKKDIKPYTNSIEELANLKTYNFFYKSDEKGEPMKVGILAQDLKKIMPEAVSLNEENRYVVNYEYINMAMVNAAKDIKKENDALSAELDELEKQVNDPSFSLCSCKKQSLFDKFLSFIRLK